MVVIDWTCSLNGESRNAYGILVDKSLGRLRRRWEANIKMSLREIGCEGKKVHKSGSGLC